MSNEIRIYNGNKSVIPVTVTEDGVAFDLTGYEMIFTVKKGKLDETIVLQKTAVIPTPLTGQGVITLIPADTAIASGEYMYEIKITKTVGLEIVDVQTIILDKFIIEDDLT